MPQMLYDRQILGGGERKSNLPNVNIDQAKRLFEAIRQGRNPKDGHKLNYSSPAATYGIAQLRTGEEYHVTNAHGPRSRRMVIYKGFPVKTGK